MPLPTTLLTTVGTITLGMPVASLTVVHDGHTHIFINATVVAMFPYGDTEVRYEIQSGGLAVGVEADEVDAITVI